MKQILIKLYNLYFVHKNMFIIRAKETKPD